MTHKNLLKNSLKILLSAYSCEPGKGSEPEVGWQWARQMARWHEVTVLTRTNNERAIRDGLASEGDLPGLRFVFHDLPQPMRASKKRLGLHELYYRSWQVSAREIVARLCRETGFDLLHHITYAGVRFPTAIFGHGVPALWGPVGGLESTPASLLPWKHPSELAMECLRNMANGLLIASGELRRRAANAKLVIASTKETAGVLRRCGIPSVLMPTIGVHLPNAVPATLRSAHLRLLFAGRLLYWKGLELALEALKASKVNAHLTVIGDGRFRLRAEALVEAFGLKGRARFLGHIPRAAMLEQYRDFDVMLYPSLHDTGGFVLLEAMARQLPVICLDCGGPALIAGEGCGFRVPVGSRSSVISGLASAIRQYSEDFALVRKHGAQARTHVASYYAWDRKGEAMNALYQEVMAR